MLRRDIELAQKIIIGNYKSQVKIYHDSSFIYKFTNEEISKYQKYLKDRNKVLSITASGDQILNSILEGTTKIDSCDVSRFPKYFFELKKAAIKSLTRKEYIDFFINNCIEDDEKYDDMYFAMNNNLDGDNKKFWDSLFCFYDASDIYRPPLFSSEILVEGGVIRNNKYLQDDNYYKLRQNLENSEINHHVGDMRDLSKKLNDNYDLINLSSIIYYGFDNMDKYIELLDNFNLNEKGKILSYLYDTSEEWIDYSSSRNYYVETFKDSNEGLMVYQKVR